MEPRARHELQNHINSLLQTDIEKKDPREVERELRRLVEPRRAPDGRVLFVPRDTPHTLQAETENYLSLAGIYDWKRKGKRQRYLAKKNDPNYRGPRIVGEGDSWLEYPCVKDTVEFLGEQYAVLSLAKAGDTWADIINQQSGTYDDGTPMGLFQTIQAENPHIVILSVGGNEIVGDIKQYVERYAAGRPRDQYINDDFGRMLDYVEQNYRAFTSRIVAAGPKVLLHSYDYLDPRTTADFGQWIGPPLEYFRYIGDQTLWRQIVSTMLERFASRLQVIANQSGDRIHFLNLLGTIGTGDYVTGPDRALWNDEIHGSEEGFRRISRKFAQKIATLYP